MDQIIFLYTFAVLILRVNGLHFLGGTITWHPLNESATGTPVAIVITQTYSWTYSRMPCNSTMIAANQLVPPYGTIPTDMLTCISNCGAGSVGYSAINVIPYCTDFSAPVGTTVGQRSDIVYLQSGDDFSVAFQDSAWRPLATNAGAGWSIAATIDVQPRSDTGLYNNAPVATMMSPIYIPVNQSTDISIPVADADGDPMRCRWSNSTNGVDECGGVCPPSSLPPGTIIYPNCTIMITGQNIGDWFGVALMVEDFINSTSTTPLSAVPVQFLVQVVGPVACNIPPDIIGIPVEGSCTSVIVGQPFVSELLAINNCGSSVTIVDIATLSFPGMVSSTIAEINSTEYYKNLTWTPTSAELGYQVMCAMAFDSQNAQSAQYCFKFYVSENGVCSCPGDPCITTTTTTTTTTSTTTSMSTTSPIAKTASMNWPLVGSIIGLVFLGALTLISYLCWRYCCLRGIIGYRKKREEIIELYHIDLCIDKDCTWPYRFYSSDVFLTSGNRYGTVNSTATTGTIISDSFGNRRNGPIGDIDEVETIVVQDRSPFPTIIDRFRHQLMSIVAVKKVKPDDRLDVEEDSHIKPPKRTAKDETNNSPIVNLRITEDVKVSGKKTSRTQKPVSMNKLVPKKNETIKFANEISPTFQSAEGVRRVRVNNLLTKPTIHHLPKSSINNKITRLEDVFNQSGEPSQSSEIINKTKFTVIHVPSTTYRKIDKKDLSRKNIHDKPESSINVEHVQIKKKKKKLKHDTALLESTVQTTHKDKQ